MKKIIAVFTALMLLCPAALASEVRISVAPNEELHNNSITVFGSSDTDKISYEIIKPLKNIESVNNDNILDVLSAFREIQADKDKAFESSVIIPAQNDSLEVYKLRIRLGNEIIEKELKIYDIDAVEEAAKTLDAFTLSQDVKEFISVNCEKLYLDEKLFTQTRNNERLYNLILKHGNFVSVKEFVEYLNSTMAFISVTEKSGSEAWKTFKENIPLFFFDSNIKAILRNFDEERGLRYITKLKGLDINDTYDFTKIASKYAPTIEISMLSNWSGVKDILKNSWKTLEISSALYEQYTKLSSTYEVDLTIAGKDLTPDVLKSTFEKAVEDAYKDDGGSSDGGFSGGGSSGGGGSYAPISIPQADEKKSSFDDVAANHWAINEIEKLTQMGIIKGRGERKFAPEEFVTRAEFVKLVVSAFGVIDNNAKADYTDVDKQSWMYPYIAAATDMKIVFGYDGGCFEPDKIITREEMAVMLYRAIGAKLTSSAEKEIIDGASISDWSIKEVQALYNSQIVSGDEKGYFHPQENATRAQSAKIVVNAMEAVKK